MSMPEQSPPGCVGEIGAVLQQALHDLVPDDLNTASELLEAATAGVVALSEDTQAESLLAVAINLQAATEGLDGAAHACGLARLHLAGYMAAIGLEGELEPEPVRAVVRDRELGMTANFQERIDAIIGRSLSPENIDTYADEALNDLVAVVQQATEQYGLSSTIRHERGIDQERAALAYFGLDENRVETTLDYIAQQAEAIRDLDELIEVMTVRTGMVITPPDEGEPMVTPGDRHLRPRRLIPRLKTIVFAAGHTFDIDLREAGECTILSGDLTPTMMRKESYKLVLIPALDRAVLVCDEEENATFVFDSDKLTESGIAQADLLGMSKDDLKAFISSHPGAGYRLKYTNHFTENVVSLLEAIPAPHEEIVIDPEAGRLLFAKQRAPRGFYSTRDIMKESDITHDLASQAIAALGDELGEVPIHEFSNGQSGPIFTADQKAKVRSWLEANEYLVEKASPDDGTLNSIARDLRVGDATLKQAVSALGDELGTPKRKRVGMGYSDVYSAGQKARLRGWLVENKKIPKDPDVKLLSADQLAPLIGLSPPTLRKIIAAHTGQLAVETLGSRRLLPEPQLAAFRTLLKELGYSIIDPPADANP